MLKEAQHIGKHDLFWYLALVSLSFVLLVFSFGPIVQSVRAYSTTPTLFSVQPHTPYRAVATFDCSTVTEIPMLECEALVALYNSTNGGNWYNHDDWLVTSTPCAWYGVSCGNGRVITVDLSNNQLSGNIPIELGNLTDLQNLILYENQLSGSIPIGLGSLATLQVISLDKNLLSGEIPVQFGNLANLQVLALRNNQLSGEIPAALGNLTKLRYLYLHANQLSGNIPAELGNLKNLQEIRLSENQLSGSILTTLGNLSNLGFLILSANQLNGEIPAALGNLTKLQIFYLHNNQLSGPLPGSLTAMHNLYDFSFNTTQLCVPDELGMEAWLASIPNVNSTGITCSADNSTPTPTSTPIAFDCNTVTEIPIAECEALVVFYHSTNGATWTNHMGWLDDTTPCDWYGVSCNDGHVATLILYENQLSGIIPPALGNLPNMQILTLSSNRISGSIPPELGNLVNLQIFMLYGNQLSGNIPPELGNLTKMQSFWLHENRLNGSIPPELSNLERVMHFMKDTERRF